MTLDGLAGLLNPMLRGWIQYFGAFRRSALYAILESVDRALIRWAMMRKDKRFKRAALSRRAVGSVEFVLGPRSSWVTGDSPGLIWSDFCQGSMCAISDWDVRLSAP